jgi:hypothetical protein
MRGGLTVEEQKAYDRYLKKQADDWYNRHKPRSFSGLFKTRKQQFLESDEGKQEMEDIKKSLSNSETQRVKQLEEEQRVKQLEEEQIRQQLEEEQIVKQEQRVKQLEEELKNIERKINKMLLIRNISDFERKQMSDLSERKEEIIHEINELNEVNQQNMEFTPYEEVTEADKQEELNHFLKALQENINNRPDEIIPKGGKRRRRRRTKRRKH